MCDVDKIISRMVDAVGAKDQTEMLEICGFSSGAAGNWKSRKKVPKKSIMVVAAHGNVRPEWIEKGDAPKSSAVVMEKQADYSLSIDWELMNEIIIMLEELQDELKMRINPEKISGIIQMIYMDEIEGTEVPKAKVIQLIKLAA